MAITIDTEMFTWRGRTLARTYIGQDKCSWASGDLDRDGKPSSHTDVTLFVTCFAPRTWSAQLWVPRTERGYYIVHSSDENLGGGHPGDCDTAEGCMARVDGEAQKFAAFLVGGIEVSQ